MWFYFIRKDVQRFTRVDANYRYDQLRDRSIIGLKILGDIARLVDWAFQASIIVIGSFLAAPFRGFGFFAGVLDGYNGSIECYRTCREQKLLYDSLKKGGEIDPLLKRHFTRQKIERISWLLSSLSFGGYSTASLMRLTLPHIVISPFPFFVLMGIFIASGVAFSIGEASSVHASRCETFIERFKRERQS